jgi:hypothetical protein
MTPSPVLSYLSFFLCRFSRKRFLRLCVAILCRLRFLPLGTALLLFFDRIVARSLYPGLNIYFKSFDGRKAAVTCSSTKTGSLVIGLRA